MSNNDAFSKMAENRCIRCWSRVLGTIKLNGCDKCKNYDVLIMCANCDKEIYTWESATSTQKTYFYVNTSICDNCYVKFDHRETCK